MFLEQASSKINFSPRAVVTTQTLLITVLFVYFAWAAADFVAGYNYIGPLELIPAENPTLEEFYPRVIPYALFLLLELGVLRGLWRGGKESRWLMTTTIVIAALVVGLSGLAGAVLSGSYLALLSGFLPLLVYFGIRVWQFNQFNQWMAQRGAEKPPRRVWLSTPFFLLAGVLVVVGFTGLTYVWEKRIAATLSDESGFDDRPFTTPDLQAKIDFYDARDAIPKIFQIGEGGVDTYLYIKRINGEHVFDAILTFSYQLPNNSTPETGKVSFSYLDQGTKIIAPVGTIITPTNIESDEEIGEIETQPFEVVPEGTSPLYYFNEFEIKVY